MILNKVRNTIDKNDMLWDCTHLIAAVSGGADSVAMLHILHRLSSDYGYALKAAHFNHMLRGKDSDNDEQYVRTLCRQLGIDLVVGSADIRKIAKEKSMSIEQAAREERYAFLEKQADGAKIATAHTKNDFAETVLFNLTRGSGITGLCGIPAVRENIIRPLIDVTRAEVEQYCRENSLMFVTDRTNFETDCSRNLIRLEVLPRLAKINSSVIDAIGRTGSLLKEDMRYLSETAQAAYTDAKTNRGLDVKKLRAQPKPILSRILISFVENNFEAYSDKTLIEALCTLVRDGTTGSRVQVSGENFCVISYGELLAQKENIPPHTDEEYEMESNRPVLFGGRWEISLIPCTKTDKKQNCVDLDKISGALTLRTYKKGDRFDIINVGSKAVNRLYIDKKLPRDKRGLNPMLCDEKGVVWICSIGVAAGYRASETSVNIFTIRMKEKSDER